jgi:hypothetical protein
MSKIDSRCRLKTSRTALAGIRRKRAHDDAGHDRGPNPRVNRALGKGSARGATWMAFSLTTRLLYVTGSRLPLPNSGVCQRNLARSFHAKTPASVTAHISKRGASRLALSYLAVALPFFLILASTKLGATDCCDPNTHFGRAKAGLTKLPPARTSPTGPIGLPADERDSPDAKMVVVSAK